MKLHELLQGIEVLEQNADPELELTGVSYDSRSTAPGELFAAISGYATDGHRFIPAALARGAACVLCEHDMPEHTPWVRVRDARAALNCWKIIVISRRRWRSSAATGSAIRRSACA